MGKDSEGNTVVNNDKRYCLNCNQISFTGNAYPKIKDNYKEIYLSISGTKKTEVMFYKDKFRFFNIICKKGIHLIVTNDKY